jgi:TRAP-type C4-dicarboxylate transport system permease small subunit
MKTVDKVVKTVSGALNWIAGAAVTFMMLLTVADILLRAGGRPIIGTFEVVSLLLAIVIAFGIPQVSLDRGHVNMDFLLDRLSEKGRKIMNTLTRLGCLILFAFIGGNLFNVAARFKASGEVSATVQLPFYPIAYGVAVCCLLECCVFAYEIAQIWREGDHA